MNSDKSVLAAQYLGLKSEMILRIAIQNVCIIGAVFVFVAANLAAMKAMTSAGIVSVVSTAAILALAAQWCHQGVRQIALKCELMKIESLTLGSEMSWETQLPGHRPSGLLGSRWLISTKGVFVGLQVLSIGFAVSSEGLTLAIVFGCFLTVVTFGLLYTNPKE